MHKNEKSFHISGFAFSLPLKERLGNDQFDGCRFWIVLGHLKSVWRLLVISQWIQPQNKDINCYFQRICLPLGEEVCYEREDKRRPKSLTKNILMVWRQDAVSLCDTGRTWHCLSELMVADILTGIHKIESSGNDLHSVNCNCTLVSDWTTLRTVHSTHENSSVNTAKY